MAFCALFLACNGFLPHRKGRGSLCIPRLRGIFSPRSRFTHPRQLQRGVSSSAARPAAAAVTKSGALTGKSADGGAAVVLTLEPAEWAGPWNASVMAAPFLAEFWQKRPLIVRGAFPELAGGSGLDPKPDSWSDRSSAGAVADAAEAVAVTDLVALACDPADICHARLVGRQGQSVRHGPFNAREIAALAMTLSPAPPAPPLRNTGQGSRKGGVSQNEENPGGAGPWSLLVSDAERALPRAHALAEAFSCISAWCHDDVMVSCSAKGAGIGAHVDSHDVVLVQVHTNERWRGA